MKRGKVVAVVVHPFYDVNLSSVRPVGTDRPEGWPSSASSGHMRESHDRDTSSVGVLGRQSNTLPSSGRGVNDRERVGSKGEGRVGGMSQVHRSGLLSSDVVDNSVGRIVKAVESKRVEEVVSDHGFLESPLASSGGNGVAVVDDDSANLSGSRSGGVRGDWEGLGGRRGGSFGGGSSERSRGRLSVTVSSLPVGSSSESEGRDEEKEGRERDGGDHFVKKEGRKEGGEGGSEV